MNVALILPLGASSTPGQSKSSVTPEEGFEKALVNAVQMDEGQGQSLGESPPAISIANAAEEAAQQEPNAQAPKLDQLLNAPISPNNNSDRGIVINQNPLMDPQAEIEGGRQFLTGGENNSNAIDTSGDQEFSTKGGGIDLGGEDPDETQIDFKMQHIMGPIANQPPITKLFLNVPQSSGDGADEPVVGDKLAVPATNSTPIEESVLATVSTNPTTKDIANLSTDIKSVMVYVANLNDNESEKLTPDELPNQSAISSENESANLGTSAPSNPVKTSVQDPPTLEAQPVKQSTAVKTGTKQTVETQSVEISTSKKSNPSPIEIEPNAAGNDSAANPVEMPVEPEVSLASAQPAKSNADNHEQAVVTIEASSSDAPVQAISTDSKPVQAEKDNVEVAQQQSTAPKSTAPNSVVEVAAAVASKQANSGKQNAPETQETTDVSESKASSSQAQQSKTSSVVKTDDSGKQNSEDSSKKESSTQADDSKVGQTEKNPAGNTTSKTDKSDSVKVKSTKSDESTAKVANVSVETTSNDVQAVDTTTKVTKVDKITSAERAFIIRQVADKIELLAAARPKDGVVVQLDPPNLGTVTMLVKAAGSQIQAQLSASDTNVQKALQQGRPELIQNLEHKGFSNAQVTFTTSTSLNNSTNSQSSWQQQTQQQSQQQQQQQAAKQFENYRPSKDARVETSPVALRNEAKGLDLSI